MSAYTGVYGTDSAVLPEVDLTFAPLQDDAQILLNDFYKLLTTPQGFVWWAPDVPTMDVGELIYDSSTETDRDAARERIEEVLLNDPRVALAQAVLTFSHSAGVLTIEVTVTAVTGFTFSFVLTVSQDGATSRVSIERVQV